MPDELHKPTDYARAPVFVSERRQAMHATFESMLEHGGGFACALALAWFRADATNQQRIEDTWPELVARYAAWEAR